MVIAVAPMVAQLSVVLFPATIDTGVAKNDMMVGASDSAPLGAELLQPANPAHTVSMAAGKSAPMPLAPRSLN
jgi:hypothetical protein